MLIEVQTQEVINGVVYPVVKQIEIEEQPIEDPRTYEQKVEKKPDEDGYTPTPEEQPDGAHTLRDRVTELEKQNQMLTQCLLEMSQIVYA